MMQDAFIGTWQLDPAQNQYTFGFVPQDGSYKFEWREDHYFVTLAWTNADGNPMHLTYTAKPDGQTYPLDNPPGAGMITTRVDDITLDTEVVKDGISLAHGRRILAADGQSMTVIQSGKTPEGQPYSNTSVYQRQK